MWLTDDERMEVCKTEKLYLVESLQSKFQSGQQWVEISSTILQSPQELFIFDVLQLNHVSSTF